MLEQVLRNQCGLDPQQPILAGVSGGPDSLCLLDVLRAAGYRVVVAHFNHRLRPEADREAESVAELARSLGLVCVAESADVAGYAEEQGLSIETAARKLRYRFLFTAARTHAAQAVAVGHTADDQVETILMHFLRGAGLDGLKGMPYRSRLPEFDAEIPLVRPLLTLWRADTEAYCREHQLAPHYDPSNTDPAFQRNRLRLDLIPELVKYNPQFKAAVLRGASTLQDDHALLQELVEAAWKQVVVEEGQNWIAFDQAGLGAHSAGLRRNLLRLAGERLRPGSHDFGFEVLERAAAFVEAPSGRQVDFAGGLFLISESGRVYLAAYEADLPSDGWPQVTEMIGVAGPRLELGQGWVLTIERIEWGPPHPPIAADNWSAWLDADRTGHELTVRPPRPGDRFQPLGLAEGTLKLSDFFVNEKLPRRARAAWPLVCAGEQVAWVVGFRPAHPFRITQKTKRVMKLEVRRTL